MSFDTDLKAFTRKVSKRQRDIFVGCATEVHKSVVEGSAITGAPGQPVDVGNLKTSFTPDFLSRWLWQDTTNANYARSIEAGIQAPYTRADGTKVTPGPMTLLSKVGGFHSVALTRAGWQRIVAAVNARVVK